MKRLRFNLRATPKRFVMPVVLDRCKVCRADTEHRLVARLVPEHTFHTDYLATWWECSCGARRAQLTKHAKRR